MFWNLSAARLGRARWRVVPGPVPAGMVPGIRAVRCACSGCWPGRPGARWVLGRRPRRLGPPLRLGRFGGATPGQRGQPGRGWRRRFRGAVWAIRIGVLGVLGGVAILRFR